MNFRTTLILVALLIGAIVGFVTIDWSTPTPPPVTGDGQSLPLFTADQLPTARVQSMTLSDPLTSATATRRVTRWWQTDPFDFPVGTSQMDRLIDDIATMRYVRALPEGDKSTPSLKDAGLAPPQMTIKLGIEGDNAKPVTLNFGDRTIGARRYAQIEGRPGIYIVEAVLGDLSAAQIMESLRFASPNAPSVGGAEQVTLTARGTTIAMKRSSDGWRFEAPQVGRVSTATLGDLMTNVGTVIVQQWLPVTSDMTAYGLDDPVISLSITQASVNDDSGRLASPTTPSVTTVLRIGGPVDASGALRYASWGDASSKTPAVFAVRSDEIDKFTATADMLRDKRLTGLQVKDIVDIEVTSNAPTVGTFHAERSSAGWSFGSPQPAFPADSGAIADLVSQLTTAEASSFAEASLAEGEPIARVALTQLGTGVLQTISVYPAPEAALPAVDDKSIRAKLTYWFVRRGDEPVGCVVAQPAIDRLMQPLMALRSRVAYETPQAWMNSVTIEQPGMGTQTFIRTMPDAADEDAPLQPGEWVLRGEQNYDERAWRLLVNSLATVRAVRWVDDNTLEGDVIRVTLASPYSEQPVTLTVDPAKLIAKVEGGQNDGTFTTTREFADTLMAELRQRTVLSVGTRGIKQIDLQRDGLTRTLSIDSDGQYLVDGSAADAPQEAAAKLFDQIAGLRVERYLSDESPAPLFAVKLTIVRNDGGAPLIVGIPAQSEGKVWLSGMIRGKQRDTWAMLTPDAVKAALAMFATAAPEVPDAENAEE